MRLKIKKMTKKDYIKWAFDIILIVSGTFLMGLAFNVFLNSNNISPSGFAGLSAIISNALAKAGVNVSPSVFYLGINGIMFIFAFKDMGVKFAINTAVGIVSYSAFIEVCKFDIGLSGSDLLLCAIYGGVIMGAGLGLVFRGRGSTGGSDMLANLLGTKFKFITVSRLVFIVDALVLALSFIVYNNLELALYSLIAIYLMTKLSDVIVSGVQGARAYYIVSKKYDEVAGVILQTIKRGVTGLYSQGMYSKNDGKIVVTIVTRAEVAKLRRIVAEVDPNAFMFSCPVTEVLGNGFMIKKTKQKRKKKEKRLIDFDKEVATIEIGTNSEPLKEMTKTLSETEKEMKE